MLKMGAQLVLELCTQMSAGACVLACHRQMEQGEQLLDLQAEMALTCAASVTICSAAHINATRMPSRHEAKNHRDNLPASTPPMKQYNNHCIV
jgi:hypothetical protein